ncbi:MAG: hypothetical protein KC776_34095 [Myxococcales bacterium]|nr:hypothetical protein [Myxococcales bacterium]
MAASCGGGSSGGGGAAGASGGTGATGGAGAGGGTGATGGNLDELPWEDPAGDAPLLDLPASATNAANSIVDAPTLAEAIAAVQGVLQKGGVGILDKDMVITSGDAPAATAHVQLVTLGDISVEAWKRRNVATLTATELGQLFAQAGMTVPDGKTSGQVVVEALAAWTQAALANPDDPTAFAVLFIAANNQLQAPRANLSLVDQDPDLVRFSLLDLELLSAAFDRIATSEPKPLAGATGPCSIASATYGQWDQVIKIGTNEAADHVIGKAIEKVGGSTSASGISKGLSVVKIGTKLWKFAQLMRYGTLELTLDSEDPTDKPLPSDATKLGKVTAHGGVDKQAFDELAKWKGTQDAINEINACLEYLGLPTKTDISDVAKDAGNWRVSWSIEKGSGTEVLFKRGQEFKILSRLENPLTQVSPTEATNTVEFEIMPQLSSVKEGTKRTRHAVFSGQLRRGKMPELDTLWGAGKDGVASGKVADGLLRMSNLLGVVGSLVDISGNWILETVSPKRFVTQTLLETVPKGWVGTIDIEEKGDGTERMDFPSPPTSGGWSTRTGKVRYHSRLSLGGSVTVGPGFENETGVGATAADCNVLLDTDDAVSYCFEACPSTIPPGPMQQTKTRLSGIWGAVGTLGKDATVQVVTYPEAVYGPLRNSLPPEIQKKIGTYEILIIPSSCLVGSALASTTMVNVSQVGDTYYTAPTYEVLEVPISHSFTALPPDNGTAITLSGPLSTTADPLTISNGTTLARKHKIPTSDFEINTTLTVKVNLRRVD